MSARAGEPDARVRARLESERQHTLQSMADLGHDIEVIVSARQDANSDDEHDPEGATLAFERSQSDALLGQTRARLTAISAALRRVDAGTYGRCVTCGQPIAPARLEARPYAEECIGCASRG